MSGGVDSSVAAALLKKSGYDVVGITMQIWDYASENPASCCSISAVNDARKVADKTGIPLYVLNFRDIFKKKVIDYFADTYMRGRTPNPCIKCNEEIKFKALFTKAKQISADFMATGHYARISRDKQSGRYLLKKARDSKKDQSYVLYGLKQAQLSRMLLPLGGYLKPDVRKIAAETGLAVADKPESMEICFVPDNDYGKFIFENYRKKSAAGNILDVKGNKIGMHTGISNYTIGQRRGLGIAGRKPLYVIEINARKNAIIAGEDKYLYSKALIAKCANFISIDRLKMPMNVSVKIRSAMKPRPAVISPRGRGKVLVEFKTALRAVTPGQAVVFYKGATVVGGAVIERGALRHFPLASLGLRYASRRRRGDAKAVRGL